MLVDQVRAVTTATKEIEAKISSDVWDRQKRWEMKQEVLFEVTRRLSGVERALINFSSAIQVQRDRQQAGQPLSQDVMSEATTRWQDESGKFQETCLLVGIVCGREVKESCDSYRAFTTQIAVELGSR